MSMSERELEKHTARLIEADHRKLMREAQVRTIMERPNFVQEEYEKWRERVGAPRQGQTREEWQRSVLEHRILSAWVTEGRFHQMGRELNKAQQRIGRQRKANREAVRTLKESVAEVKILREENDWMRRWMGEFGYTEAFEGWKKFKTPTSEEE